MQETAGLGEQALNKLAEMALASQLPPMERLEVQIKTDLNKLARGEVDSIAIDMNDVLMQQNLNVEELQLHIGRVTVKPLSAIRGKIKLTQPSSGTLRIVINEDNLSRTFNYESFYEYLHQMQAPVEDKQVTIQIQEVKCSLLADGKIDFHCKAILGKTGEAQAVSFRATPRSETDGQEIVLQDVHYVEGELPPEITAALVAQVSEVLSLRNLRQNFQQKGMTLQIQQLDVVTGKLTLQAAAYIEQFPSS